MTGPVTSDEEWAGLMQARYFAITGVLLGAVMSGDLDVMDIRLFGKLAGSFAETAAANRRAAIPSFTCPRCGSVSRDPNDIANSYCGAEHLFTADPHPED